MLSRLLRALALGTIDLLTARDLPRLSPLEQRYWPIRLARLVRRRWTIERQKAR